MLPHKSRTKLSRMIEDGQVTVNGDPQKKSFKLEPGMRVALPQPPESAPHDLEPFGMDLDIAFEDESVIVVNKPRGLAVHPAPSLREPTLVHALLARSGTLSTAGGAFRPGIVHRLDKATTGLMLVAKSDRAHMSLARQIERRTVERRYLAVVAGDLAQPEMLIDAPIGRHPARRQHMAVVASGRRAVTHVSFLSRVEQGSLLECRLETGRTHQIRVHLAAIGHPVIGDPVYAPRELRSGPMLLHAYYLAFDHPLDGTRIEVRAKPPEDFVYPWDLALRAK